MSNIDGKKIIIFGGTSTIAVSVAREFAAKRCKIYLVARDTQALKEIAEDLKARGAEIGVTADDFVNLDKIPLIFDSATKFLGGLDGVVVAHGSLTDQTRAEHDCEFLASELNTNFISAAAILLKGAEILEKQQSGFLAAISSVAGDRGRKNIYIYGSAKAALTAFMSGLRGRLAKSNVQVLTIKPGFVRTKMTAEMKQGFLFAEPEVVARDVISAIEKRREVVYTPWFWQFIMLIIKMIPEKIFKRMSI